MDWTMHLQTNYVGVLISLSHTVVILLFGIKNRSCHHVIDLNIVLPVHRDKTQNLAVMPTPSRNNRFPFVGNF